LEIEEIIKEIQKEAQVRKSQPPHPDSFKLQSTPIQIVEPPPNFFIRIIRKLHQCDWQSPKKFYLWLAGIPKWGYPFRFLLDLVLLPKRNDLLERYFTALNQRIETELWPRHEEQIRIMNSRISEALNQLKQFDKNVNRSTSKSSPSVAKNIDERWLDQFYVDFENRFRGTKEDILRKQSAYLPYLQKSSLNFKKTPVLDLGCGRGEWLTTLKNTNIAAKGVDQNKIMIEECLDSGLDVVEHDVIEYLNLLEPESIGVITGFHIVEHLPFLTLVQLLDESLRALISGGIAIFETPNPENLMVGSCNFYTDPTHRNPIPPHTLSFMLTQRGFIETTVLRLSPLASLSEKKSIDQELYQVLESYYKEQDYAVIAKKF